MEFDATIICDEVFVRGDDVMPISCSSTAMTGNVEQSLLTFFILSTAEMPLEKTFIPKIPFVTSRKFHQKH